MMINNLFSSENIKIHLEKGLKILLNHNLILHCHHYNSRLQRTIEDNRQINGKKIIKESVSRVFYSMLQESRKIYPHENARKIAGDLYLFLGFGVIDLGQFEKGIVTSPISHFVEGWKCGSIRRKGKACTFTEGYLMAACKFITHQDYDISEIQCMNESHDHCIFEMKLLSQEINFNFDYHKKIISIDENKQHQLLQLSEEDFNNSNINKEIIVNAVITLPLYGNDEGLIPAFNVYLANMPQDVYNLMVINFVEAMEKINLGVLSTKLLIEDAENCALNTFDGILNSDEWTGLVGPMIKQQRDKIFGLVAVANGLGWGRINIVKHVGKEGLILSSTNGYESFGYREFKDNLDRARCYMLTGITSGLMELIYEKGEIEDRSNLYISTEEECLCKKDNKCLFVAKYAE